MKRFIVTSLVLVSCTGGGGSTTTDPDAGAAPPVIEVEGGAPVTDDGGTPITPGASGAKDPTYANPGGNINAVALQSDGKVIVGGQFTNLGGGINEYNIARTNADGSLDPSFTTSNTQTSTIVSSLALQPDGKVVVGGNFVSEGMVRIGRLNADGTRDTAFNPTGAGAEGGVSTLLRQPDGKTLVGGFFTTYNGAGGRRLARVNDDGSFDTTFNVGKGAGPLVGPYVDALALQPDGKVIVGGTFETFNDVARPGIARLNADGSVDTSFDPGGTEPVPGRAVYAVALQPDGKVLIGGLFLDFKGTKASYLVRLAADGTLDAGFNAPFVSSTDGNPEIRSLLVQPDGKILVGGLYLIERINLVQLNADGSRDTSFTSGVDPTLAPIRALVRQPDGKVLVGGDGGVVRIGGG